MLSFDLARRIYTRKGDQDKAGKPAVRIATLGIAIGIAVMIVSVCVVLGFKHTIRDKVVGYGSHITVANFMTLQTTHPAPIQMNDSMISRIKKIPGVKHVQRYALTQGILKTDNDFIGIGFKGVAEDFDTTFFARYMVEGTIPHFSSEANKGKILVSRITADKLHLHSGDKIYGYFMTNGDVRMRKYEVSGIYDTNLSKFDETLCFIDLYSVVRLNGWEPDQATGAEVQIDDFDALPVVSEEFVNKVNKHKDSYGETYCSATVDESYPQLFSWLELLDLNVWIILILMISISAFTIVSGLLILILERVQMIGLLKALGARNALLRHTFLWLSLFVVGKGMVIGNILALGICILQNATGLIKLDAATYYVSEVPVEINVPLILLLNVASIIICTIVLTVPTMLVSRINPAESMRYE